MVSPLDEHLESMTRLAASIPGHLTERETRFLALVAAVLPPRLGDALEIGSFKGKSTVILAKSVQHAGGDTLTATDPLTLPAITDPGDNPETLADEFRATLDRYGVRKIVEFHQLRSAELAAKWDRPLRLLWIDGDHTYEGASADFLGFSDYLQPGGIVAFHDVLNRFEGPLRVFLEVVRSSDFGACGVCGSIGWAQRIEPGTHTERQLEDKRRLARKLDRLIPCARFGQDVPLRSRWKFRFLRAFVPHGDVDPRAWVELIGREVDLIGS